MNHDPKQTFAPRWWQSLEQLEDDAAARAHHANEFASELPVGAGAAAAAGANSGGSRRDFFKVMGLSATAAMAACQRAPEQKIFPYTRKPDEVTPGVGLWYATACGACAARCGLLVKTRDGRPIKIEGNPDHPVSRGAVCAIGQASVLGLYDDDRARGPRLGRVSARWPEIDAAVEKALGAASAAGRGIRVVVPWGLGPTTEAALDDLLARHAGARVVRFDPLGHRDAIAAAHEALYGSRVVPDYRLDSADLVVSFAADFLGTWIAPARFARQWSDARAPERAPRRLRHVQIEANLSLTGGAADQRIAVPPSSVVPALAQLVVALADGSALGLAARDAAASVVSLHAGVSDGTIAALAADLRRAGPRGLVLAGSEEPAGQLLAALANAMLDNGATTAIVDARAASRPNEQTIGALAGDLAGGNVGAVLFLGTNPALVDARIGAALPAVPFSLSTSDHPDETAALCTAHAPAGHWLEGWTDDSPRPGADAVAQPCVGRLFDTRPLLTSLVAWSGGQRDDYRYLKARWEREGLAPSQNAWDAAVRDGIAARDVSPPAAIAPRPSAVAGALAAWPRTAAAGGGDELVLYASVALADGTGQTSNNGWLQELPDPIGKVTWGNYAALAPARAAALGVGDGDVVELRAGSTAIRLPVLRQPGLPQHTVAVALGYGRDRAGRVANGHGVDAWPLAVATAFGPRRSGIAVSVARTGQSWPLALTQTHASQEGRELVRDVPAGKRRLPVLNLGGKERDDKERGGKMKRGLWPGHSYEGHRWGLAVDLDKCTGCAACIVSCSAENNVPIVGAVEVGRRREMHWLRIDRYYGGSAEAPRVLHQPMMCQHCENAPCETVCPVLATVHSSEGLNQQIYNRCVGTRYCANNCPIKTRRFNWFDYDRGGDLRRMALNPDVVVRTRGVMEKCSMCVQRIEEGRALANRQGRTLADGDIRTACQQSCPSQAIVFGDRNDPKSALSRLAADGRAYVILEELNVKPQVTYLARVSSDGDAEGTSHG